LAVLLFSASVAHLLIAASLHWLIASEYILDSGAQSFGSIESRTSICGPAERRMAQITTKCRLDLVASKAWDQT
jgi:hypothetical protein